MQKERVIAFIDGFYLYHSIAKDYPQSYDIVQSQTTHSTIFRPEKTHYKRHQRNKRKI